jgi:serine/threonine protein kinase
MASADHPPGLPNGKNTVNRNSGRRTSLPDGLNAYRSGHTYLPEGTHALEQQSVHGVLQPPLLIKRAASGYGVLQPPLLIKRAASGYGVLQPAPLIKRAADIMSFDENTGTLSKREGSSIFVFPDSTTTLGDYIRHKMYATAPILGKGMSGTAYRIDKDGHTFVLKHVTNPHIPVSSILHEIDMLSRVRGKWFAVQLLAAEVHRDGTAFLLFPYIPGEELFDVILPLHQKNTPTAEEVANIKRISNALLEGLHELHEMGIIHRDIKPENIWVPTDPSIAPFFLDFGLSATTETPIKPAGTLEYIRPERHTTIPRIPSENDNYYAFSRIASHLPRILDPTQGQLLSQNGLTRHTARNIRFNGGTRRRRKITRRRKRSV